MNETNKKNIIVDSESFPSLNSFLEYVKKTIKGIRFTSSEKDSNEREKLRERFDAERNAAYYTIDSLIKIERVIERISGFAYSINSYYHLGEALKILTEERRNLLDLLEYEIVYIANKDELSKEQLDYIENTIEDIVKYTNEYNLEANTYSFKKEILKEKTKKIDEKNELNTDSINELEQLIDEITKTLNNSYIENPVRLEAKEEVDAVKRVYSPEVIELTKSAVDSLRESNIRLLELEHLESLSTYSITESDFEYRNVKQGTKAASRDDKTVYRKLRKPFKNLKKACKHLKKLKMQLEKFKNIETENIEKINSDVTTVVNTAKKVIRTLEETKDIVENNNKSISKREAAIDGTLTISEEAPLESDLYNIDSSLYGSNSDNLNKEKKEELISDKIKKTEKLNQLKKFRDIESNRHDEVVNLPENHKALEESLKGVKNITSKGGFGR